MTSPHIDIKHMASFIMVAGPRPANCDTWYRSVPASHCSCSLCIRSDPRPTAYSTGKESYRAFTYNRRLPSDEDPARHCMHGFIPMYSQLHDCQCASANVRVWVRCAHRVGCRACNASVHMSRSDPAARLRTRVIHIEALDGSLHAGTVLPAHCQPIPKCVVASRKLASRTDGSPVQLPWPRPASVSAPAASAAAAAASAVPSGDHHLTARRRT